MTDSKLKKYPSIAQSFGLTGIAAFIILFLGIVSPILNKSVGMEAGQLILLILGIGIPLWIAYRLRKKKTGDTSFNLSIENKRTIPYLLIGSAALIGIINPISGLIPMPDALRQEFLKLSHQTDVFTFIILVIVAPVLEEFLFRGVILDGLLKKYSTIKSISISALLFGLVHLNPWQFVAGFIMGIFIGWVYHKTKSLATSIIIHAAFNLSVLLTRITFDMEKHMNSSITESYGGQLNLFTITTSSILVMSICVYYLNTEFNKKDLSKKMI